MIPCDKDTIPAKLVALTDKGGKIIFTVMVNKCIRHQLQLKPCFLNSNAEFNVFSHIGMNKTSKLFVNFSGKAHIVATSLVLGRILHFPTYTPCGQESGHAKIHGLLPGRESIPSIIRSSMGIKASFCDNAI